MSAFRFHHFLMALLCIVLALTFLTGCTGEKPKDTGTKVTVSPEPVSPDDDIDEPDDEGHASDGEVSLKVIRYYSVNAQSTEVINLTAMVQEDSDISAGVILDFLIDSLEDEGIKIIIDSVSVEDGVCIISFDESIKTIAEQSIDLEYAILDAAAQSVLDNIDECGSVCYRILGQEYETVNNHFSIDEIYMDE